MSRNFFSLVNQLRPSLPGNAGNQVRSEYAGGNGRLAFRTRGLPGGRKNLRNAGLGAGRLRRAAADPRAAGGDGGRRAGGILSGSRRVGPTRLDASALGEG